MSGADILGVTHLLGPPPPSADRPSLARREIRGSRQARHGDDKSRLVADALRTILATIPNAVLIQELCQSYEQTTAYATVSRLLRRILRLSSAVERAQQSVVVLEQLEQHVATEARSVGAA